MIMYDKKGNRYHFRSSVGEPNIRDGDGKWRSYDVIVGGKTTTMYLNVIRHKNLHINVFNKWYHLNIEYCKSGRDIFSVKEFLFDEPVGSRKLKKNR